ncbi:uncharacterized protein LOC143360785 isoform X2 [Halictus rubicundus]|uniref:uncharacterized protein LOC143360785 isoform X2 n=1 Tax=Halictus rubicundus TaxID=77578 RepID=UPI0040359C38
MRHFRLSKVWPIALDNKQNDTWELLGNKCRNSIIHLNMLYCEPMLFQLGFDPCANLRIYLHAARLTENRVCFLRICEIMLPSVTTIINKISERGKMTLWTRRPP